MNPDDVTELLRDMRHEAGLTQQQLGDRLGLARNVRGGNHGCPQIAQYERGARTPGLETFGRWAAACGFTAELTFTRPGAGRWTLTLNDKVTPL